jgi:hypothetical protein
MEKNYNKEYYINVLKEKVAKPIRCEFCKCEFKAWNVIKHSKTKKHLLNIMTPEDRILELKRRLDVIEEAKIAKTVEELQKQIEEEMIKCREIAF